MNSLYNFLEKAKKQDREKYEDLVNCDREKIINLLINYLNEQLGCKYLYSIIEDINGNSADALILEDSELFLKTIEGHDLLSFNVEQLIDDRYTINNGEIIILDLNGSLKNIDITYLVETIKSKHIAYSRKLINYLDMFLDLLVKRKLRSESY